VTFGDATHAVAVGSDGPTVVRTSDGGATWLVTATNGTTRHLSGVAFADATHGWAVGAEHKGENTILATADGGITWARQHSGLAASLTAVDCTDASHAWAVGFFGTILVTTDGGATWTAQDSGVADHHLKDVAFADASHGWAVGQGTIVATSNGGSTWTQQDPGVAADLRGVTCVDATHAWAVGTVEAGWLKYAGVILATNDGGVTWTRQDAGVTWNLEDVAFADASHGWTVGTALEPGEQYVHGTILTTTDGGATWTAQRSTATLAVACIDADHVWALGPTVASDDGGATWTGQTADFGVPLTGRCIFFLDSAHGWVVGDTGVIYATTTGGWTPPSVKVSGAVNNGWYNHTLDVTLTGVPASATTGIASVTWALDGGQRHTVAGASTTVRIPVDTLTHGDDGVGGRRLVYSVTDDNGITAPDRTLTINIDTRKPTTKAPYAASVYRYADATLKYKVVDPAPNGGTATVTIKIKNSSGKVVKTLGPYKGVVVNKRLSAKLYSCQLRHGTYRFSVFATDKAGNLQALPVGSNRLTVH
jgi:photosystem II stability/assembly factor-like uncharacterized protein